MAKTVSYHPLVADTQGRRAALFEWILERIPVARRCWCFFLTLIINSGGGAPESIKCHACSQKITPWAFLSRLLLGIVGWSPQWVFDRGCGTGYPESTCNRRCWQVVYSWLAGIAWSSVVDREATPGCWVVMRVNVSVEITLYMSGGAHPRWECVICRVAR